MARRECWRDLEDHGAALALLQEVPRPPPGTATEVLPGKDDAGVTTGWPPQTWRTAIARLSDNVTLDPRPTVAAEGATTKVHWAVTVFGNGSVG